MESTLKGPEAPGEDLDGDGIPSDLHWAQPSRWTIAVECSPNLAADYRDFIRDSIKQVNDIIGTEWLSMEFASEDASYTNLIEIGGKPPKVRTVYVHSTDDDPTKGVTNVFYRSNGEIGSAEIALPEHPLPPGDKRRIALHELLHSIGLAHDENEPHSIMYPYFSDLDQHVTEADLALLRRVYGSFKVMKRSVP